MNPAGVGSSTSNRAFPGLVSPGTIREILQTGGENLINDAFEQWATEDMTHLLESIKSPPPITVSPVGVGSAASNLSQSPGLPRTPTGGVAGADGGSSPGSSAGSRSGSSAGPRGRGRGRGSTPQGSRRASTPQGSGRASTPQGLARATTSRGRPQQAQKQPRGRGQKRPRRSNPYPTLPWSRPGSSAQAPPPSTSQPSRFTTSIVYVVTRSRTNRSGTTDR